jgi:hypothetical protein
VIRAAPNRAATILVSRLSFEFEYSAFPRLRRDARAVIEHFDQLRNVVLQPILKAKQHSEAGERDAALDVADERNVGRAALGELRLRLLQASGHA